MDDAIKGVLDNDGIYVAANAGSMSAPAESDVSRAERLLAEAGFEVEISGCGCCGSPRVTIVYKGELILNDEEEVHLNSFGEDKA